MMLEKIDDVHKVFINSTLIFYSWSNLRTFGIRYEEIFFSMFFWLK
jgi:hypothetical protein